MRLYKGQDIASTPLRTMHRSRDFPDGTRQCSQCGIRKPLDAYYRSKDCALGRRGACIACSRTRDSKRRAVAPDVYAELDRLSNIRRRARLASVEFDKSVTVASLRAVHGDLCAYCGVEMVGFERGARGKHPGRKASIEHVVPISQGGAHTFANTVLACLDCNFKKHARTPEEWAAARL